MKRYEGLFILNTAGKEETLKDTIDKITADITSAGGKVETVQKMDKKPFARVADRKYSTGFYVNFVFEGRRHRRPTAPSFFHQRGDFPRALYPGPRSKTCHCHPINCLWPISTKSF